MDKTGNYWINKDTASNKYCCPNVSLFRFISSLSFSIKEKKVLEIGFNNGADLLEFNRRGAIIYGLDINPLAVSSLDFHDKKRIKTCRCGIEAIPFDNLFDLIYSRDTIYYLSDKEIKFFFNDAANKIKNTGLIIVQFIERDFLVEYSNPENEINFNFFKKAISMPIFNEHNPIRFLSSKSIIKHAKDANLEFIASKRLMQSYDLKEEKFRLDRYMAFKIK